jgi:hypothetical protein
MIAPESMDALADVARALGFELRRAEHAVPVGIDYDRAKEQTQFALLLEGEIAFDGTARECSAFLIGWRDLRSSMLGAMHAVDVQVMPTMNGWTPCGKQDGEGHRCLRRAGHSDVVHSALVRWEGK